MLYHKLNQHHTLSIESCINEALEAAVTSELDIFAIFAAILEISSATCAFFCVAWSSALI